jgi:NitT/TauT family transport system permease protein
MSTLLKKTLSFAGPAVLFAALIFLWEYYTVTNHIPKRILPRPSEIGYYLFREFFNRHRTGYESILMKTMSSFTDAFIGFAISAFLGSAIGILFARYKLFRVILLPIVFLSQIIPLPAFAPVVAAVFGYDITTKIIIIVLFTIFPVIVNVEKAVHNIAKNYLSLFKTYNASNSQVFIRLIIPSIIPNLLLTLKIISTATFVASIISELSLTVSGGIGKDIFTSFNNQVIARVWASLFIVSLVSLGYFALINAAERYVLSRFHYGKNE